MPQTRLSVHHSNPHNTLWYKGHFLVATLQIFHIFVEEERTGRTLIAWHPNPVINENLCYMIYTTLIQTKAGPL
jgi:hypothetical protein